MFTNTFLSVILQMTVAHPNLHSCHRDREESSGEATQRKGKAWGFCKWRASCVSWTPFITPVTASETQHYYSVSVHDVETKTADPGSGIRSCDGGFQLTKTCPQMSLQPRERGGLAKLGSVNNYFLITGMTHTWRIIFGIRSLSFPNLPFKKVKCRAKTVNYDCHAPMF